MTAIATRTLTASETALLLRIRLGSIRAWGDFLADCIRDRTEIAGYQLLPCGRVRERCWRPVYAVTDIEAFIASVLSAIPGAGKSPITPMVLEIDRGRHWRINKFDQTGAPIPM